MTTCDSALEAREEVAERTTAFRLAKPPGFSFKPGQAIDLIVPGLPAEGGQDRHAFSIASAPSTPHLVVATRMRDSAYKRALEALPVGAPLRIEGPFGALTLHKDPKRPAVLIAGGIGITPFMSMLRSVAEDPAPRNVTLLYSNRRPEDAAFLEELQELDARGHGFSLVATMTGMALSKRWWTGHDQPIDAALVRKVGAGQGSPIYYLAGPPAMVDGLRKILAAADVDDDDIRSEEFHGY